MATGIIKRHTKDCRTRAGGRCNCDGCWQAAVYSKRDGRKIRKHFTNAAEAKTWRADALTALSQGTLRAATKATLRDTAQEWLRGAESGEVRNRSGQPYKPATLRGYRQALEDRVLPEFGAASSRRSPPPTCKPWSTAGRASACRPRRSATRSSRCRRSTAGQVSRRAARQPDPRPGAACAAAARGRDRRRRGWPRSCSRAAAAGPAGVGHGAVCGPALRRAAGAALGRGGRCRRHDRGARVLGPKGGPDRAQDADLRRTVPMPGALRDLIARAPAAQVRPGDDKPCSGRRGAVPRRRRSTGAPTRRGSGGPTERLRLHQARHTYASFMIAAGVNAKALAQLHGPLARSRSRSTSTGT